MNEEDAARGTLDSMDYEGEEWECCDICSHPIPPDCFECPTCAFFGDDDEDF